MQHLSSNRHQSTLALVARQRVVVDRARFERFAHDVGSAFDGSLLRYSQRNALLRVAQQNRISRFDANLIIAAVQHQQEQALPKVVSIRDFRTARPMVRGQDAVTPHWLATATMIGGVQALLVAGIWLLLHGLI